MKSNRYIRQISLKDFGPKAQQRLSEAKVLIIGLGGLGIPVTQYLNAMGVGVLGLVEKDVVDITNLQRQVLYAERDIGKSKLGLVFEKLKSQNSDTEIIPHDCFLTKENALEIIFQYDVVVDASDNFPTRYLVNDACVILKKPFVYGALHGFEGQVSVFNYKEGPTYRCLFPEMPSAAEIPNCNDNGVLGVIPGIVGNLQALETVKMITEIGEVLSGKLLIYNGLNQNLLKINFSAQPNNLAIDKLRDNYSYEVCESLYEVSFGEFQKRLDTNPNFQILDVRAPNEFEVFHLPNSVNIPLNELERRINEINLTKPIYAICQSGKRSGLAVEQIKNISKTTTIFNVQGGLNALAHVHTT